MGMSENKSNRRDFLKTSAVAGGVLAANMSVLSNAHAQGTDEVRVGLIGCGGRGTGAAVDCLHAGRNVRLIAMGDAFPDRVRSSRDQLTRSEVRAQVDVPDARMFTGLGAIDQVLATNCNLVILATPPGFRPTHLRAAVAARKHIFTEKPATVDGPGARMNLETFDVATRNNLSIVAGTQRRYQTGYKESMARIHDGDIGTITSARCYWNQGRLWNRARTEGMGDLEWQIRNWLYFTWLSGDHITEQHVHNLDVCNWALRAHPVKCIGLGGRQVRTAPEFGHIYDHFAIDFEYPNGAHVLSMARQIEGCANKVAEEVTGTRGKWTSHNYTIAGERAWNFPRRMDNQPYRAEHVALIESITNNRPINDLRNVTESSLTAVMGRMACYTGQEVTWQQALESTQNLMPARLSMDMELPVPPVAMPGTTRLE